MTGLWMKKSGESTEKEVTGARIGESEIEKLVRGRGCSHCHLGYATVLHE